MLGVFGLVRVVPLAGVVAGSPSGPAAATEIGEELRPRLHLFSVTHGIRPEIPSALPPTPNTMHVWSLP
jgi:hypothetical protein